MRYAECKAAGCGKLAQAHGLCMRHANEDPSVPRCTYPGCDRSERAKRYCQGHYQQHLKGQELKPFVQWNEIECRGPLCQRNADYRDGYCKRHHAQKEATGEVWVIGTRKNRGRSPVVVCVEAGCETTDIAVWARCLPHAVEAHGECWLPWCDAPGHHATGLCDPHSRQQRAMTHAYGIGWQGRAELAEAQGHVCAVCGHPDAPGAGDSLHIDHEHATGRVRGLLCGPCNRGIGLLRDNPEFLQNAIDYLRT